MIWLFAKDKLMQLKLMNRPIVWAKNFTLSNCPEG